MENDGTLAVCRPDQEPCVDYEAIDEKGDVLLQIRTKGFLVSSKVLSLASIYFERMFKSEFREGLAPRSPEHPLSLDASDDDPEGLAVLLHTIHFSKKRVFAGLDIRQQLQVAILCDKYDVTRAMYSDSFRWLQTVGLKDESVNDLWAAIATAYLMKHEAEFAKRASRLVQVLPSGLLDHSSPPLCLPDELRGELELPSLARHSSY